MDPGTFWTMVGAIAALGGLVGVGFAIAAYRRQNPKRLLEYVVRESPLIAGHSLGSGAIQVIVGGAVLHDPYVISLDVHSPSKADIPSALFDGGRPIRFRIEGVSAASMASDTPPGSIALEDSGLEETGAAEVWIRPQLIRKRATGSMTVVADGRPTSYSSDSSLIDTDLKRVTAVREPLGMKAVVDSLRPALYSLLVAVTAGIAVAITTQR